MLEASTTGVLNTQLGTTDNHSEVYNFKPNLLLRWWFKPG